jgi:SAM-dependent methyltransferase
MMASAAPDPTARAAAFWDQHPPDPQRSRWWMWPRIIAFQNERICGKPLPTWNAGLISEVRRRFPGRCFRRAISVGCGAGGKELLLLKEGLVQDIDLFEISTTRIEQGQQLYQQHGLSERAHWHRTSGIEALERGPCYDLVFWDNSLHHMTDTPRAVRASSMALEPNGVFVMNDFVGATRFQWSDRQLRYSSQVRKSLSDRLLRDPRNPKVQLPRLLQRPSLDAMISLDPSEAADSERILPAIRECLPDPQIWLLGGAIYHLALNDVLANLDETADKDFLDALLVLDSALIEMGETHYAACIAIK